MFETRKAKRQRRPLKINLEGLSGAGKTFTAIRTGFAMKRAGIGRRIVVADSENNSADLYAGIVVDGEAWDYEVCPIPAQHQNPTGYTALYEHLIEQGFDIIIIDSMSHAWHGAMDQVDRIAQGSRGDKFAAWANVTPAQRKMIATLTDQRAHLITTMRVKSEYERVEGANGKDRIKKVGMKTDQREGTEYEFDVVARLDQGHDIFVEKVRGCTAMDGRQANCPDALFWKPLFDWWLSAADPVQEARDRIKAAADEPALVAVWKSLPKNVQEAVVSDKDAKKATFATSTPAAQPTAATAVAPTPEQIRSVKDRIGQAATKKDLTAVLDAVAAETKDWPEDVLTDVRTVAAKVRKYLNTTDQPAQKPADDATRLSTASAQKLVADLRGLGYDWASAMAEFAKEIGVPATATAVDLTPDQAQQLFDAANMNSAREPEEVAA
jgi:hypothetical protein